MHAPRCIAAPVTLAADSRQIVSTAAALAEALDAELVLVGIAPPGPPARPAAQVEDGNWLATDSEQRLLDLLVRERLDELSEELPAGIPVRAILTWGPPGPALIEAAHDQRAELIVVAMRRESALGHALHDHNDRHVLHHSDVPVLVVPTSPRRGTLSARGRS
jgi:nucleotide-binding universal stress UspA family protein